jgi:phospholipid/cholesterol/gamma-HCH transport system substrate-binding protein
MIVRVNRLLEANERDLKRAMETTNGLLINLSDKVEQLGPLISKGNTLLDSVNNLEIQETVQSVNLALNQVNTMLLNMDSGEGTVGQLMKNDSLYQNLNQLLIDLDKMVIHFNQYPKDFLKPLGRKNSKLKGLEGTGN